VTSVDEMSKLRALRRARERLETALASEEGWQALRRSKAVAGAGGGETARLETELRSNPLYRAWTNVNAAIEARQRGGRSDASGPTAPPASTSAADLDPGRARLQSNDGHAGAELREPDPQSASSEEEASVSFVAFVPPAPTTGGRPAEPLRTPASLPPPQSHKAPESTSGAEAWGGEEAEVSLVSVDARRHAGAVDRLLRALRGETTSG